MQQHPTPIFQHAWDIYNSPYLIAIKNLKKTTIAHRITANNQIQLLNQQPLYTHIFAIFYAPYAQNRKSAAPNSTQIYTHTHQ